ncbi:acyl-CoA thioesterase domain-containing protein [Nocardia salmonicida]|uniref:acyl-CoA thioesterase domain-containing protein n=1 Tax=Nocardia salmonicida TaxID=53431 RepID=UPI003408E47A
MNAVQPNAARPQECQGLADMLFAETPATLDVPSFAWGFGGLHGGLALSLVASSVQQSVPGHSLRSITGQFLQPIRDTFTIESQVIRSGRSAAVVQATGCDSHGISLTATAILGVDQPGTAPLRAPKAPDVPGPQSVPPMEAMDVVIPVLSQVDVRPVGSITRSAHSRRSTSANSRGR